MLSRLNALMFSQLPEEKRNAFSLRITEVELHNYIFQVRSYGSYLEEAIKRKISPQEAKEIIETIENNREHENFKSIHEIVMGWSRDFGRTDPELIINSLMNIKENKKLKYQNLLDMVRYPDSAHLTEAQNNNKNLVLDVSKFSSRDLMRLFYASLNDVGFTDNFKIKFKGILTINELMSLVDDRILVNNNEYPEYQVEVLYTFFHVSWLAEQNNLIGREEIINKLSEMLLIDSSSLGKKVDTLLNSCLLNNAYVEMRLLLTIRKGDYIRLKKDLKKLNPHYLEYAWEVCKREGNPYLINKMIENFGSRRVKNENAKENSFTPEEKPQTKKKKKRFIFRK